MAWNLLESLGIDASILNIKVIDDLEPLQEAIIKIMEAKGADALNDLAKLHPQAVQVCGSIYQQLTACTFTLIIIECRLCRCFWPPQT
jgi:hypothetical protein